MKCDLNWISRNLDVLAAPLGFQSVSLVTHSVTHNNNVKSTELEVNQSGSAETMLLLAELSGRQLRKQLSVESR